ncbi:MAG: ABC transporter permease [Candidatus Spechtbacterales bacterium]|nr:ABC transporter permease [Candidatus Spechtbacterales bacterium]
MKIKHTIRSATGGLKVHKSRSALTVLGILIGIAAIIMMVSLGGGAEGLIVGELGGLGAETIVVRPGQEPTGPADFSNTLFADSIKERDVEALKQKGNVPDLLDIMPAVIVAGSMSYEGETFQPTIMGGDAEFIAAAFDVYPVEGYAFGEDEIQQNADVVVIGDRVREELFADSSAVGEFVKVNQRKMRVIGVLPPKGQVAVLNVDSLAIVPHTTAQTYLSGRDYYNQLIIKISDPKHVDRAVVDIERTMRISHGITDPDDDDFYVETQQGIVEQVSTILGALTVLVSSIAAIALVVGGVGVMNIMLVSVAERTKEIGLRKSLGATNKDISRQFLIESILLAASGGLIGIILGSTFSFLVFLIVSNYFLPGWTYVFPVGAAVLGFTVSSIVGLIFGIYPAKQAAKKSPIEALRYE